MTTSRRSDQPRGDRPHPGWAAPRPARRARCARGTRGHRRAGAAPAGQVGQRRAAGRHQVPDAARARGRVLGDGAASGDGRRVPARGRLRRQRPELLARRPVPAPAHAGRDGPAPDRRGQARGAVARARRPGPARTRRHLVRGLGAQRARRPGHRRLQPLGRPRPPDALARQLRACGSCSCRASAPARSTSSRSAARTAPGTARPTRWPRCAEAPPGDGVGGLRVRATSGPTRTG